MQNTEKLIEELENLTEDLLYEMATITSDEKMYIAVNPDPSRGWYNEEYFKVYNHQNRTKATKVARIKFREPVYVYHKNKDGKQNWILNSKEKKHLIELLTGKDDLYGTIWKYAICQFNTEAHNTNEKAEQFKDLTIEKQNQMKDDVPQKYYLPIDLPIPDYTVL